jgi:hypothetical protein
MVIEMWPDVKEALKETQRFLDHPSIEYKEARNFLDKVLDKLQADNIVIPFASYASSLGKDYISQTHAIDSKLIPPDLQKRHEEHNCFGHERGYFLRFIAQHSKSCFAINNLYISAYLVRIDSPNAIGGLIVNDVYEFDNPQNFIDSMMHNLKINLEHILKHAAYYKTN